MIIPVRCFSCGKVRSSRLGPAPSPSRPFITLACLLLLTGTQVIGDLWERYLKLIDEGMPDG